MRLRSHENVCDQPNRKIHPAESRIFWAGPYVAPAVWSMFAIGSIIGVNLQWFLVNIVGVVLTGSNMWGYYKCNKGNAFCICCNVISYGSRSANNNSYCFSCSDAQMRRLDFSSSLLEELRQVWCNDCAVPCLSLLMAH